MRSGAQKDRVGRRQDGTADRDFAELPAIRSQGILVHGSRRSWIGRGQAARPGARDTERSRRRDAGSDGATGGQHRVGRRQGGGTGGDRGPGPDPRGPAALDSRPADDRVGRREAERLSRVLAAQGNGGDTLIEVLRATETIGSDGDKAHVLTEAARSDMSAEAVQRAFFSAANTIGSDGDRKAVLTAALHLSNRPASLVTGVTQSARRIGSDGDKAAVLSRAAEFEMNDAAARASFFGAVNTIGSDGDRANVLSHVLMRPSWRRRRHWPLSIRQRLWDRTGTRRRCCCWLPSGMGPIPWCEPRSSGR